MGIGIEHSTDNTLLTSNTSLPTSDTRLPISDARLRTSDARLRTTNTRLPTTNTSPTLPTTAQNLRDYTDHSILLGFRMYRAISRTLPSRIATPFHLKSMLTTILKVCISPLVSKSVFRDAIETL